VRGRTAAREREPETITHKALLIVWNLTVLAALGAYVEQFSSLPDQSTLFPRLISYPVAAMTLVALGMVVVPRPGRAPADGEAPERIRPRRLFLGPVLGVVYLLLWEPLGFQLDTILFLVLAPLLLGYPKRRISLLAAIAVTTAVLFVFLFHLGSGSILPSGLLRVEWP